MLVYLRKAVAGIDYCLVIEYASVPTFKAVAGIDYCDLDIFL